MKRQAEPLTIDKILETHRQRRPEIRRRLREFRAIWKHGSDADIWREMVFCFFTGGCSARMGLRSIEAVRRLIDNGSHEELTQALLGVHRYPNARSRYIVASRDFLTTDCGMRLRKRIGGIRDHLERRDWLVKEKGIKGLGYKEASHFLRNIGFSGYGILDKHVLNCLFELKIIDDPKPPNTRARYLSIESELKGFSEQLGIDFDEMDLVLWSIKTGEILK